MAELTDAGWAIVESANQKATGEQLLKLEVIHTIPSCFTVEPSYEESDRPDLPGVACFSLICNAGDEPKTIAVIPVPNMTDLRTLVMRAQDHWRQSHAHVH